MANRVCVLLSGCGAFDGSDIHEAILTQLALDRLGARVFWAAPDMEQRHVLNHLTQEEMDEQRHVLVESARIARGDIVDLTTLDPRQFDALIMPGGSGTLKNLSDFALKGPPHKIDPKLQYILNNLIDENKPVGAIGMSAVALVIALSGYCLEVTIGDDQGLAAAIESMGNRHHNCRAEHICVDIPHKIVTTPAYMTGSDIKTIATGIEQLTRKIIELIES